jgi:hypothetical protein
MAKAIPQAATTETEQGTWETNQQSKDNSNAPTTRRGNTMRTALPWLIKHATSMRVSNGTAYKEQGDDQSSERPGNDRNDASRHSLATP